MGIFNRKPKAEPHPSILIKGIKTPYDIENVVQQIIDAMQPAPSIIPTFSLGVISKLDVIQFVDGTDRTKHKHMLKIDTEGNIIDAYVDADGRVVKAQWNAWPEDDNSIGFKVLLDTYRSNSLYIKEVAALFSK